jgi:hypothetical protein
MTAVAPSAALAVTQRSLTDPGSLALAGSAA